jgi:hypothetical protein
MVAVLGFPRNVYPPDATAKGKTASANGPDVEAYKRVVSRAGRWPWQTFDQAYSNSFAHGKKGGNVSSTGAAGVQRQSGITASGWVGEQTFNLFRSIRIPAGLPHAGEPAMDANAQTLIAQAYKLYHPPNPPETVRQAALREASKWIGTTESPAGSNQQMFGAWYGMNGVPWCAIFVSYCFEHGIPNGSPSFQAGVHYSYVPTIVDDAQNYRNGLQVAPNPIPGDLVCYDWDGGGYDHVGIYEAGDKNAWTSVEGNTGDVNYSNGGAVLRCNRNRGMAHAVTFVRVADPSVAV